MTGSVLVPFNMKILVVLLFFLYTALAIGWVVNIVKFIKCDFKEPYTTEIVRGIGIVVAPVGGIIGYINIGEEK